MRYVYLYDRVDKANLTVPILPFSKIDEMGAGMYKGQKRIRPIGETVSHGASSSELAVQLRPQGLVSELTGAING